MAKRIEKNEKAFIKDLSVPGCMGAVGISSADLVKTFVQADTQSTDPGSEPWLVSARVNCLRSSASKLPLPGVRTLICAHSNVAVVQLRPLQDALREGQVGDNFKVFFETAAGQKYLEQWSSLWRL